MYKIKIDNFIFHVNVTEYSTAIPGSYSYNADSDVDYYGYPMEIDWECNMVTELHNEYYHRHLISTTYGENEASEIVEAYAEKITCKLLDIIKFEQECAEEVW